MASNRRKWQPDMVVGIDFGMTCTGVAWSSGPDWPDPKTLQHWPGKLAHELRNKVDTAIAYQATSGLATAWGFLCDPDDERLEQNELFKLYLDPSYVDDTGSAPTLKEARQWFRDYLRYLHEYITTHFRKSIGRFDTKKIEYVFSIPTTWRDPVMIAETEEIIRDAGFGRSSNERASIYLTEAEAAAVYTSKQTMEVGDCFLVCDIGGGTSDLNVLKVNSAAIGRLDLIPLSWTEGKAVGSSLIDFQMQQVICDRLRRVRPPLEEDVESIAAKMIQGNFMTFKCAFGDEGFKLQNLYMTVPGMQAGRNYPDARIQNSKMLVTIDELRAIFDEQVNKLFNLIDQQLRVVASKHPKELITYLVLSGGLGSSHYIQQRIRSRYENNPGNGFKNAKNLQLLVASEPQLAVCHGLVIARSQECKTGSEVLTKRCSPASYGIISRELYDSVQHHGQQLVKGEDGKRTWAVDQIAWIIRKGDLFDTSTGATQTYQMNLALGEETMPWKVRIAMSTLPEDQLPRSIHESGAKTICEVEFSLDARDFTLKNKHWYQISKPYYTGVFDVKVIVGTGLKFEIWSKDRVLSKEHEEVKVEWVGMGDVEAPRRDGRRENRMYRVMGRK